MSRDRPAPIQQAAAVPYRWHGSRLEFCLITSRKGNWQFPKGIIDPGETPVETAQKEAEEEAGLHGELSGEPLGRYKYAKWGTTLVVTAFLMDVDTADDDWEESAWRDRRWCRPEEARALIRRDAIRALLEEAIARLNGG